MVPPENHRLVKQGWTDSNFWDSIFGTTASQKSTVENKEKTDGNLLFSDILDEASNN